MRRIATIGFTVLALLAGRRVAAAQEAECGPALQWMGAPMRSAVAALSGDRILVQLAGEDLVADRAGVVQLRRPALWRAYRELVPRDGGFWQIGSDSTAVVVDALDADGVAVGAAQTLGSSIFPMNAARADVGDGTLAVAWTAPVAQFGSEFDIHLVLIAPDRSVIGRQRLPARAGAYSVQVVVQGDVVWLLWREDPFLRLLGQRFARADGAALDAAPIEIGRGFNDVIWARVGDQLRLYTDAAAQAPTSFVLTEDGTVTSWPVMTGHGRQVIGTADGAVIHVGLEPRGSEDFPTDSAIRIGREDAAGVLAPLADLRGADVVAVADGPDTLVLTLEDSTDGDTGLSRLMARRIGPGGAMSAATEVARNDLERVEVEVCTYPDGCSAGGAGAAAWLPLLAACGLIARRRRARGTAR